LIGVHLKAPDVRIVDEFFQLFKTPWEFYCEGSSYEVIISDHAKACRCDAKILILLPESRSGSGDREGGEGHPAHRGSLLEAEGVFFPVYTRVSRIPDGEAFVRISGTGDAVGTRSRDLRKTILRLGFNFFEEARFLLTFGQPVSFAGYPTLDIHIANLRKWILTAGVPIVEIPPISPGRPFFACLTHDVDFAGIRNHKLDHTLAGFVYRAVIGSISRCLKGSLPIGGMVRNWMAVLSLPLVYLGLTGDFWNLFREYIRLENGAGSTFFVVPFKGTPGKAPDGVAPAFRAVKYEVADLQEEITHLLGHGCEVGVHGIDSWADPDHAKEEIAKIESLAGRSGLGVRMHWLYYGPESPAVLEKAGYIYDSTCGYNETIGCRAGTFQVFRPLTAQHLLELPMHIMDTALFYPDRMNLSPSEGLTWIDKLTKTAEGFGGVVTFNWHDRSIAPERLWDGVYRTVLQQLRLRGVMFSTAGAVVEWFRKRRALGFKTITAGVSSVRIELAYAHNGPPDDLVLRVYTPEPASAPGKSPLNPAARFRDFRLDGRKEMELPL
jgi:hypothetical protein